MITEFHPIIEGITKQLTLWEPILANLPEEVLMLRKNKQNRTIKQIVGHLIDSASNNTHRIIHLQNQLSPLIFPNYATYGNNDRWIAIQDYQNEDWMVIVNLWKYANLHLVHVIKNVDPSRLDNCWESDVNKYISLKTCIIDYLPHLELHLGEIEEMIDN
ncbi:MAG: DinB family protein [Bacteroidales bacterium]|nr:DinB family protein [Bacteroidales bacterium]